ncbi:TIGR03620 family F420-dependent LLM class oxidoreductase [Nocardia sp. NPDC051463]|uniref:TIGR03620 family F420-dependent LLM class oxidoreductase n=1 Tax=Nocardia sp. NPDC051463 TaxID=3154845 RepID=UPI00342F22EC
MNTIDGRDLGTFGIYTWDFEHRSAAQIRADIQELEDLGWRSFWFPEVGGREAFTHAGLLLAATRRIHIVNGIATIGQRTARATHGATQLLADAYPGRHVLGLGVSAGIPGVKPLAAITSYLDELDALAADTPQPRNTRVLAAYGPKMLEQARDRAAGAHTYKVTVEHTAQAREILGPKAFLGVEHAVLFESDPEAARAIARTHLHVYLNTPFNVAKFRRLGYSEDDVTGGGSDRLVDDLVFWGEPDTIVEKLRAHVDAGADHVAAQVIGIEPGHTAMPQWRLLAEAILPEGIAT